MNDIRESRSTASKEAQDVEEEHDDIDEQEEGPQNVVIHGNLMCFASHNKLSVHDQVDAVDDHPKDAVESVENLDIKEESEQSEKKERHYQYKQQSSAYCKICLGCHGIDRKSQSDACGHYSCHNHDVRVIGGTDRTHYIRERDAENKEQNVVDGHTSGNALAADYSNGQYYVNSETGP